MNRLNSLWVGGWRMDAVGCFLLLMPHLLQAQSGRANLDGWVAFEGVAYVDSQPRATVQLRKEPPDTGVIYSTTTDAHGFFHFRSVGLGQFILRIAAPKFQEYTAEVYMPSDFVGNWAVLLKARAAAVPRN